MFDTMSPGVVFDNGSLLFAVTRAFCAMKQSSPGLFLQVLETVLDRYSGKLFVEWVGIGFKEGLLDASFFLSAYFSVAADMFLSPESPSTLVTQERFVFNRQMYDLVCSQSLGSGKTFPAGVAHVVLASLVYLSNVTFHLVTCCKQLSTELTRLFWFAVALDVKPKLFFFAEFVFVTNWAN